MVRLITLLALLALLAAMAIAAIMPVSWFLAAQSRLCGKVAIHAQLYAGEVSDEAHQNPVLWNALADSSTGSELQNLRIARPPP